MSRRQKLIFPNKTIHQCFQLIYFILYHCGFLGLKTKNGIVLYYDRWFKIYGYLYRLLYITGLFGGFSIKVNDEESYEAMTVHMTPMVKVILIFECLLSPLIYLKDSFNLDNSRDKYLEFANTLQKLDEQLQHDFHCIRWNYYKCTRKYILLTVVFYVFYTVIATVYLFNITHCTCGLLSSIIIAMSYAGVTSGPGFIGVLFCGNVDILRLRFRLMRKLTHQCLRQTKNGQSERNFKLLTNYFKEYSSLIVLLNNIFEVTSSSGLFHDFALITSLGYLLCSKVIDANNQMHEYIFILLFMTPRMYRVLSLSIYGFSTQKECRNGFHEIVKMEYNSKESVGVRKTMNAFLHWHMHSNYNIKIGTTINCNLALIFLILNSVANYIMILIQLQYQQNDIVKQLNNVELISNA